MSHQHTRSSLSPAARAEAHRTYREEMLFDAIVTAGAVVALADRRADASERAELASFVARSRRLPNFTPADAAEAFDSRVRQFELTGSVPETDLGSLRHVSDAFGIREIVRAAELVALADGCMQPDEAVVLGRVRAAMRPSLNEIRD